MGDIGHAATLRLFGNGPAGGSLGAHEDDVAALGRELAGEVERVDHQRQGLFQVDDVNLAPRAENVRLHLGVPIARLVSEVHASL